MAARTNYPQRRKPTPMCDETATTFSRYGHLKRGYEFLVTAVQTNQLARVASRISLARRAPKSWWSARTEHSAREYALLSRMSSRLATGIDRTRVRVQLDLAVEEVEALDDLKARCGLRSRADAVRLSLAMLEWMREQTTVGRRVVAVGERDVVYLAVPGMRPERGGQQRVTTKEVDSDG